jgi:hypothetical protein
MKAPYCSLKAASQRFLGIKLKKLMQILDKLIA